MHVIYVVRVVCVIRNCFYIQLRKLNASVSKISSHELPYNIVCYEPVQVHGKILEHVQGLDQRTREHIQQYTSECDTKLTGMQGSHVCYYQVLCIT